MPIPLALGIGAGVAGGVMQLLNRPKQNNYDFGFDLQQTEYNANPNLLASIQNLNNAGANLGAMGNKFMNQYEQMIDPNSAYAQSQRADMTTAVGDASAQQARQQQEAIASAGGPASLAGLLRGIGSNRATEAVTRGMRDLSRQNMQMAGQFGQMATGAHGAGAQAYGQAGQFGSAIDARTLQNAQQNAQAQNQYNQYLRTSGYNQMVGNQQALANWRRGISDSLMSFAGGGNFAGQFGNSAMGNRLNNWFGLGGS